MAKPTGGWTPEELNARVRRIGEMDRAVLAAGDQEVRAVRALGDFLRKTKDRIKDGWMAFVRDRLPFHYLTAARYMAVAEHWAILEPFAPLGKTALYELAEIAGTKPAMLKGLTWKSSVGGRKLRDLDCHEIRQAFFPAPAKPQPARPPCDPIKVLTEIKRDDPAEFAALVDDLVALIGDGAAPAPAHPPGVLTGRTRDDRAAELLAQAQALLDNVDDIDDVPGKLSPALKIKLMQVTLVVWREVNRLPAFAQLPAGWKPSSGPVQGVVLRPR